jgi:hypothetical protein
MRKFTLALVLGALALAGPARAAPVSRATASLPGSMDNEVSIFGLMTPYGGYAGAGTGVGVGARYQMTLVPEGILHASRVRDDIGLEFGLDWDHYSFNAGVPPNNVSFTFNEIAPVLGGVWNFWFNDRLAIYPKVDLFYRVGWWSTNIAGAQTPGGFGGFDAQFAAGIVYKLDKVALRAEVGSYSLRLGVGF